MVFYYWYAVLVNIISCVSAQLQFLEEKGCKVALIHAQDNTYGCIRVEMYEEKLHYCFFILAVSIICSFDRLFNNEKATKMKKRTRAGLRYC